MSAINGDKSRFNRERKKKIASRARNGERLKNFAVQPKPAVPQAELRQKELSA